jgi:hypothetical protein
MTPFEKQSLLLQYLQLAAIGLAAAALHLQYRSYADEFAWNKRTQTLEIVKTWESGTKEAKDILIKNFPGMSLPKTQSSPSVDEFRAIIEAPDGAMVPVFGGTRQVNAREVRSSIASLFNYYETLAIAYENDVVDRTVFQESLSPAMLRTCDYFENFRTAHRQIREGQDYWPPLSRMLAEWRNSSNLPHYPRKLGNGSD